MSDNITYIYIFIYSESSKKPTFTLEKAKVKETERIYRCVEENKYPFQYSRQVNKNKIGVVFKEFDKIVYYSLSPDIEVFKCKVAELLNRKISNHERTISELRGTLNAFNKTMENSIATPLNP